MGYRIGIGIWLSAALAANAQSINVRGKIAKGDGGPIANAVVELVNQKLKDTTGADGMYGLLKQVDALRNGTVAGGMSLRRGVLLLSVGRPSAVKVELFGAHGELVSRESMDNASPGEYAIDIASRAAKGRLLVIRAGIGGQSRTFRYFGMGGGGVEVQESRTVSSTGGRLAKVSATVDSLRVSAAGYVTKSIALSTFDTTVNLTLDASNGGVKNPPVKSAGCGKTTTVTTGTKNITSGGQNREYIIDIPANYDKDKAYRLFYCSHWIGSTDDAVATGQVTNGGAANWGYYGLKRMATTNNEPAIFIAPQSQGSTWQQSDHALFENILAYAKENLCVDESRVFATGFSFGGMITYSLSTNHQKMIRAAVGIAPANYNIWLPSTKLKDPIAWMSTTGMNDGTCPWDGGTNRGARYIAIEKATDNGCTIPATIPTWQSSSGSRHICYDFAGCKEGYPVKACTFNGNHQAAPHDAGGGDNGLTSWIPTESWKFFSQF